MLTTSPPDLLPTTQAAQTPMALDSTTHSTSPLTFTPSALRMNHIQVIATHNSYHLEATPQERAWHARLLPAAHGDYYYSHATLAHQLAHQGVRSLELDIWADYADDGDGGGNYATPLLRRLAGLPYFPIDDAADAMRRPGAKVLHVPDRDVGTTCHTLALCLAAVRRWSAAHPRHVPISIMLEFKTAGGGGGGLHLPGTARPVSWNDTARLDALDAEIRAIFPPETLLTPDDLRAGHPESGGADDHSNNVTLERAVLTRGWPDLDSARGRVLFVMDDGAETLGAVRHAYAGYGARPSLEGRVVFTQSAPGEADCAFQKLNAPLSEERGEAWIREQVRKGYWVRTRADIPLRTLLSPEGKEGEGEEGAGRTAMRDAALRSGAHMVSTDWPAWGMSARYGVDYVVRYPGGRTAVCNPVNAPEGLCGEETELEPPEYYQN